MTKKFNITGTFSLFAAVLSTSLFQSVFRGIFPEANERFGFTSAIPIDSSHSISQIHNRYDEYE